MLAVLFLPFALQAQNSWTVADGTTTHASVPLDFYNTDGSNTHRAQMLYPASLLSDMSGATIGSVTFYHQNTAATKTVSASTWYILMGETTEEDLSAGFSTVVLDTVYAGNLQVTNGVFTFDFTMPYTYNGGNLIVEITTTGTTGNYFGSSSQGCFGEDNIGSTYSSMSSPNYTQFLPKTTFATPPTCFPVTNLAINAELTTSSSLSLSWSDANNTGASYDIYAITPTDTTLVDNVSTMDYTAYDLNANTAYIFGVAANCGGGDLSQIALVGGRTACDAMALPWTCGFETSEIQSTAQATALPWCSQRFVSNVSSPYYPYSYSASSSYLHNGSRCLYFYGTTDASYPDTMALVLPQVDITNYPMNANRITFWARMSGSSYSKTVYVCTMSDPNDLTTLTLVDTILVNTADYTKYSVALTAANDADAYVVLAVLKGSGSLYMDDLTLEVLPSCVEISNLTVNATTSSSITLAWTDANNDGASYDIYAITPSDTILIDNVSNTEYTVSDLNANTTYVFGVAANCGGGDMSLMELVSGLTDCGTVTMPWIENFDTWSVKSPCWSFMSGQLSTGTPTPSTSAWTLNSTYGSYIAISGKALTMNLYSSNKFWAVTPPVVITSDDAILSVDVAVAAWSNATPNYDDNDTLALAVSTDDGVTFSNLLVYNGDQLNALGNTYTTLIAPVSGYNGQTLRFAIYGGSISGTSPHDNRIAIDNVSVIETPDCLPVVGLAVSDITAHTATLTWSGNADGYTIYDMNDTTVYDYASDTTVVIYALTSETSYTFGVTANCGSNESDFRTVSFTTQISCPAPTDLTAILTPGDGSVATLTWTAGGEETAWQICLNNDTNNLIDVTDNTYDLSGLTPEQAHTAKVRAICDMDDMSAWSGVVSFTPTDAYILTVNDGTNSNSYVPIYGLWVDDITKSQFIIPANLLSGILYGNINKLTFYSSDANKNWGSASFEVYLSETNETSINSLADYSTMTQVYAGSLSISNNVMEVTFNTPYLYTGGNLMVGFLQTVSGSYSSCSWYGVNVTGASMGGYGTSISQRNFLPKTTISFTPGEEPACLPVSGLTVSNITADEATLTWNGEADSYNIYAINGTDTILEQTAYDATITLTGLSAMTQYTYGVRAVCGGSESEIRTVTFSTACSSVELPYTETFTATSATRECWNLVSNNTTNIGGTNGMGFVTVSNREVLRFSSYSSASDYNQYGYSPLMTVNSEATNLMVKVVYATYGPNDHLNFGYVTETDTVWDATQYNTTGDNNWQSLTFVIPPTATQLAVHYYGNFAYYGWIDSVIVTEMEGDYCAPVTALTTNNVSATSVSLTWNSEANNFFVIDMADGSVVATSTENSVTIEGLTESTSYTFGVVTDCGTSISDTVIITAHTACTNTCTLTINASDAYGDGWDASYINVMQNGASIANLTIPYNGSNQTFTFNVCSGEPVTFAWVNGGGDYDEDVAFTILDGGSTTVFTTDDVTGYTSGAVFFTLQDPCPSCIMPVVTLDNVTETTATISWTSSATSFDVYNGSTVVATGIGANTYTFTGLSTSSAYTFGVVANCTDDDVSLMATITVMTECADITTLPYNEGFEAGLGCWSTINGSSSGEPWSAYDCAGLSSVNPHSGSYVASSWSWKSGNPLHANAWLISPKFVLPNTTEGLTFTWWESTNANYPDHYSVSVSTTTNDTAAFTTVVHPYAAAAGEWTIQSVDLSAYAGQNIYIAFHHVDYDANYLFIDDITLSLGGFVPPAPDTLTVTFAVNDATMGTTVPAPGTYQYITGDTVSFSPVANPGYHFTNWVMTAGGVSDTLASNYVSVYFLANTFMSYGNLTLTALFEAGNPDSTTVTYAVNDATMGTITPAPGTYTIYVGNNVIATATPNTGYQLNAWIFGIYSSTGAALSVDTLYYDDEDFANPMNFGTLPQSFADSGYTLTITAVFEAGSTPPTQYTVTLNTADANMGTVSPAGTTTVNESASFTATATANAGYHFVAWMSGTTQVSTANPYTFAVNANTTLTATFEADPVEPCAVPTGLHTTAVENHAITIAWDAQTGVNNWNVQYREANATSWTSAASNTNSYTISNLNGDTDYEIQVQANCGDGNLSDWSSTLNVHTLNVGVEVFTEKNVVLFPNPARQYVDIRIDGDVNVTEMEVYDVYGKLINNLSVIENPTRINVTGLANGMYFVRVTTDEGVATKTFIKK